jgi:acetoacetyl-CoA synthetase
MRTTVAADSADDVLWQPPPAVAADSAMARYARYVCRTRDVDTADYERLWAWSVRAPNDFWASAWEFFDVQASRPY